ncbi:hypothetical protein [Legionella shakespearei]|uniref:RhoGEF domain protein n=1 Tax=Legionella shakespearei DSM 23087 TaxID=1122169 RepID=A0A0W0Z376_9GAMM|nr:hypothetical protein [Legionella shakespearei]KTD63422.1 RhoGEF domain protein [Legionella shakespearei DSM 23087]
MGFKDRLKAIKSNVSEAAYHAKVEVDYKRHSIRDNLQDKYRTSNYGQVTVLPDWYVETNFMGQQGRPFFASPKDGDDPNDPVTFAVRNIGSRVECVTEMSHFWGMSSPEEKAMYQREGKEQGSPATYDEFLKEQFDAAKVVAEQFNPISKRTELPKLPEASGNVDKVQFALNEMATTEHSYHFDCRVTQKLLDDLIKKYPADREALEDIKGNLDDVVANAGQMSSKLDGILQTQDVDGKLDVYYKTSLTGDLMGNVMMDCGVFSARNAEQIAGIEAFMTKHPGVVEKAYEAAVKETKQEFNSVSPEVGGIVAQKAEQFMNSSSLFSAPMQRPMRYPMMADVLAGYTKNSGAEVSPVLKEVASYLRVASQMTQLSVAATQGQDNIKKYEATHEQEAKISPTL